MKREVYDLGPLVCFVVVARRGAQPLFAEAA